MGESQAPVIVKDVTDGQALELALIENIQRQELNPMEEASAYQRLSSDFGLTQEEIASRVGKDRATVANTLRLLKLSKPVQDELSMGRLTLGHARALLALESEKNQAALATRIVREGLSVRQVEQWVKASTGPGPTRGRISRDPHLVEAERKLQRSLGTSVQIIERGARGWVRIHYYSLKDLDRLLARIGRE